MNNYYIPRILLIIASAVFSSASLSSSQENTQAVNGSVHSIESFQWQHRIILIKNEMTCDKQYSEILLEAKAAIDERHILWFEICDGELQTNYSGSLSEQFIENTSNEYFVRDDINVVLIGKDGGVKRRTDSLNLDELFTLIDSMPMRQSEMNQ